MPARTIIEVLEHLESCEEFGARFVQKGGTDTFHPYSEVFRRARAAAAALQAAGLRPGDRVAILLGTSIEFFDAFLGTQLAGGIPAALYPPVRLGKLTEYFTRTRKMLRRIGARFLVTESRIKKIIGPAVDGDTTVEFVFNADELTGGAAWKRVDPAPESPAFLQFSSGTTLDPKAVEVSHTGLIANLEMMASCFALFPPKVAEEATRNGGVCWLPLYHDMGLVGCLYNGLYRPGTVTYIAPEMFIARPALWLQTISKYKGSVSPAPHFAYSLCANKVKDEELAGVDLSSWIIALNGAEPIEIDGMNKFCERFAKYGFRREAMTPVYGLAEAGLAVSFSNPTQAPVINTFDRTLLSEHGIAERGDGRKLPGVGRAMPGLEIRIGDENDQPMPDGQVGKILLRGLSITTGYFNDPELTSTVIRNGWLDTGDLGFFFEDELYIAGRAKDLIIIRGRNLAPQEIEELVFNVEGVRVGCVVALSQNVEKEGEQLIVLAERDPAKPRAEAEIQKEIETRILQGLSIAPHYVGLVEAGTLPRTSSGKMRRSDALRLFLAGELTPPDKVDALKMIGELGKSQIAWGRFWLRRVTR